MPDRKKESNLATVVLIGVVAGAVTAAGIFIFSGMRDSNGSSANSVDQMPHLREDISVFEVEIYKTDNAATGGVHDGPWEVVIIGEKDQYQAILRDPLLFSADIEGVEESLNQGVIPDELLTVFETEGYPISSVTSLENLDSGIMNNAQRWRVITGSYDTYNLEKDNGKIYVYCDRKGTPILVENVSEKEMSDGVHSFLISVDEVPYRGSILRSTYPLFVKDSSGIRSKDRIRLPIS